jgi:hypothetical protein
MKKFIISEEEKNRILGLHETAKINYGTVISEQSGAGQPVAQPTAQPTTQNTGVANLSIFDKYVPTKEEVMNYVKSLSGLKTDEDIEKAMVNPFYTKMYKIIEPLEVNVDIDKKSLPTQGENWREWYLYKGMADKDFTGNIRLNPESILAKAPGIFTQVAQKYDWENLKKNLAIIKEWAMANPNSTLPNRGSSAPGVYSAYSKYLESKGAKNVDFAKSVAYNLGLIKKGGDLTPLRNLS